MSETAPIDVAGLVERLRGEIALAQGDAAAWGIDTYGDLPKTLALLNQAAAALQSLSAEMERTKGERDSAVDLEEMQAKSLDEEEARARAAEAALQQALAERDEAWKVTLHAREMTKALTSLTAGGSEFFVRVGEEYYADIERCVTYIKERTESLHRNLVEAVTARKTAESELARLTAALSAETEACAKVVDSYADKFFDAKVVAAAIRQRQGERS